jgi:hypothetical protein
MSELNSINKWIWNCEKDLDYQIRWGENSVITIQRNLLRRVTFSLLGWNPNDGWLSKSKAFTYSPPTSEPVTFPDNGLVHDFGSKETFNKYWGKTYVIEGVLMIVHGPSENIEVEDHVSTVSGCFRGSDPNYNHFFAICPYPPEVPCEP